MSARKYISSTGPFALAAAEKADAAALDQLLQLCLHELSAYGDAPDVGPDGRFEYPYLELYWLEPERHPYLLINDQQIAGMALVREGDPHEMAEFFVLNKYRRKGIGTWAARELFKLFPGQWIVREMRDNEQAQDFWRRAIPYPYSEATDDEGVAQCFEVP